MALNLHRTWKMMGQTSGLENKRPNHWDGKASIFRPTFDDLMFPKCTKLHRFAPIFSKFSGVNTSGPTKLGKGKPLPQTPPHRRPPTVPLFQSFRGRDSVSSAI